MSMQINFDEIDLNLLREIQKNSRLSNVELARRVQLSPPATHARLRKLEEQGVIQQYTAILDRDQLGFDLLCFIHIRMHMHDFEILTDFQTQIRAMPEVLECHHLTGQFDYVLKVALRNRRELQDFVREKLVPLQGVTQIITSVLLEEVKSTPVLPIGC